MNFVYPYIAFEGPIAAGKTTHAQLLAQRLASLPLLENFAGNEFLEDFYGDKKRWALPMQLSFLASRYSQLRTVVAPLTEPIIMDFSYLKDSAFAELLLSGRELHLYKDIAAAIQTTLVSHHLIVYLDARNEVLLDRIKRRNRAYEAVIDTGYQNSVRDAYEKTFRENPQLKIVRYDTSDLDLNSAAGVKGLQDTVLNSLRAN